MSVLKVSETRDGQDTPPICPVKIGSFSSTWTSGDDAYEESAVNLKVLKIPSNLKDVSFDLKDGYKPLSEGGPVVVDQINKKSGMKQILTWVSNNRDKIQKADFVTCRAILSKVMRTPYEKSDGFVIGVTKFQGVIYMYEFMTDKRRAYEEERDEKSNMLSYGGLRFEQYITESAGAGDTVCDHDVYAHAFYSCIIESVIGDHVCVYNCEMDCIKDKQSLSREPLSLADFCEIVTTTTLKDERWYKVKPYKLMKWWSQCYVTGTEKVVCGFRDEDMVVREIEVMSVSDMTIRKRWYPHVCRRFLDKFLAFVKQTVHEDDPNIMYEFSWSPPDDEVKWKKTVPTEERCVLPEDFIQEFA